jgi:hypothetical protein
MHALVEVVAGFAVMRSHLVGDDLGEERTQVVLEGLVVL